jgi:hypothetical protein
MPSSSLLFGWVLCACAVMAASQPVVGTQDQVDQLVDGMKKSMDAIVSHLKVWNSLESPGGCHPTTTLPVSWL